jgi:hypothetical protein
MPMIVMKVTQTTTGEIEIEIEVEIKGHSLRQKLKI